MRIRDFAYVAWLGITIGMFTKMEWWQHSIVIVPVILMVILINEKQ